MEKYGVKASSGGGRSSARETIGAFYLRSSLLANATLVAGPATSTVMLTADKAEWLLVLLRKNI